MENAGKHFKKQKLMAKMLYTCGLFQVLKWPISADTLDNFSFSYLVTLA